MSATLTILTKDHILAYVDGDLPADQREDVEAAIMDDDRARRIFQSAKSAQSGRDRAWADD